MDTRERYGFTFKDKPVTTIKKALPVGDYGVYLHGELIATVERKSLSDLVKGLSEGDIAFQFAALASMPTAAVVVDARYSQLLKLPEGRGGWAADRVARLQTRYTNVPIVWADSKALAEDFTYRFLGAALAHRLDEPDGVISDPKPWRD
jgi:ERCC4-type nuclease